MKLLIVEDEIELANALAKLLRKNNYSVETAKDGEEALLRFELENYDAIILDIMMPKINGIEVLKIIRKTNTNIPIIMLTAKAEVEDKVLGLDSGANDYLEKPFDTTKYEYINLHKPEKSGFYRVWEKGNEKKMQKTYFKVKNKET